MRLSTCELLILKKQLFRLKIILKQPANLLKPLCVLFLGQHELDEMLSGREKLSTNIQDFLDQQTDGWGIKVSKLR
ncbi:MAG: hypothetical protein CM1200mP30_34510 [Pseudomonadota bacterium]|nr:MAG: hypothetical protein CM1200mP30_34510 [Pseudomonadota bacterium]